MFTPIEDAARAIRDGQLVAFPTETVYGLGANALDAAAVTKIFEVKGRPRFDPLIVHVADVDAARAVLLDPPPLLDELARHFWPGPLTIVAQKHPDIPDLVTAGNDTVAVRIPAHPVALALLTATQTPIAAPSANRFGSISPTCAEHVVSQLGDAVDIILDGGPCDVGVESTIITLATTPPMLLRPGGTSLESIERVIGPVEIPQQDTHRTASPGRLTRHYAPRTPLHFIDEARPSGRLGLLTFDGSDDDESFEVVEVLSPTANLSEAAQNLFAALRRLDGLGLDAIVASVVPEHGLGRAIMDRLRRAHASSLPNDRDE